MLFRSIFAFFVLTCAAGCLTDSDVSAVEDGDMVSSTENDIQIIIQLILDQPDLQQYFHTELPGNVPVKILRKDNISDGISISKFTEPAIIVNAQDIDLEQDAYFDFEQIDIQGNAAHVLFRYPFEGVRGTYQLKKSDGTWAVESGELVEE